MLTEPSTGKRWFEYLVQIVILYSIVALYVESELLHDGYIEAGTDFFVWNERVVGSIFTLEYLFRWWQSKNRKRYPFTLLAVIDLVAVLPFFITLSGSLRSLRLVRTLRMLFILRLFKLYRYNIALQNVMHGFRKVKDELAVVGFVVVIMVIFSAMAIHEFEHDAQPERFGRLSDAVWWSCVTLTTVGYGDLYPVTVGGRIIAVLTMVVGIGIFGTFISLVGSSFLTTMREQQNIGNSSQVPRPHYPPAREEDVEDHSSRHSQLADPTTETIPMEVLQAHYRASQAKVAGGRT